MKDVYDKDETSAERKFYKNRTNTIDLHGMSLENANVNVKKFIEESYENKIYKIKVITGKGLRSRSSSNPYLSSEFSNLKNSVPEFIKHEEDIMRKIKKIYLAKPADGGDGAFYILLKNFKG